MAENLNTLMCLDVYLASLDKKQNAALKHKIKPLAYKPHPLLSDGILQEKKKSWFTSITLKDLQLLQKLHKQHRWNFDLQLLLNIPYQAIVLTNALQQIEWVSAGFEDMTGYSPAFMIGKKPNLLQGKSTSKETRERIRKNILARHSFTESIINYRRNNDAYLCRVSVFPIHDHTNSLTHFIALESEII